MHFFHDRDAFREEFVSKCSGADGVSKEAEASGKFNRESWAKDVIVVGFGRVTCNHITDAGSKEWVKKVDVR